MLDPNTNYVKLVGNRYLFSERWMPHFKPWASEVVHIDFNLKRSEKQPDMQVHAPHFNHAFLEELGEKGFSRRSFSKWERIMHSHGATLQEVFILRHGSFKRVADVVIYPESHDQVEVNSFFTL